MSPWRVKVLICKILGPVLSLIVTIWHCLFSTIVLEALFPSMPSSVQLWRLTIPTWHALWKHGYGQTCFTQRLIAFLEAKYKEEACQRHSYCKSLSCLYFSPSTDNLNIATLSTCHGYIDPITHVPISSKIYWHYLCILFYWCIKINRSSVTRSFTVNFARTLLSSGLPLHVDTRILKVIRSILGYFQSSVLYIAGITFHQGPYTLNHFYCTNYSPD